MQFLLLGPLEVHEGDRRVPLGGPKQRVIVAHLLLERGRVVTAERLVDTVWGDDPPATARKSLQAHVKNLRKVLGSERIVHRSGGYAIHADTSDVDLMVFGRLVDEARGRMPDDLAGASDAFRRARSGLNSANHSTGAICAMLR